jgi:thioredoxin 1
LRAAKGIYFKGKADMSSINLTTSTFDETVGASNVPVVVDFWAEWCGPCKMVAPILDEIATENAGQMTIAKLNVDENPDIAMRYQVMSIPTMIVFNGGEAVHRIVGAKSSEHFWATPTNGR